MITNIQGPPAQSWSEMTWVIDTISKIMDTGDNSSTILLGTPASSGYVRPRIIVAVSLQFTISSTQSIPYGHRPIIQLFASPVVLDTTSPRMQTLYYKYSGFSSYKPTDAEVAYGSTYRDTISMSIENYKLKITVPSDMGWFAKSYATVSGTLIGYQS